MDVALSPAASEALHFEEQHILLLSIHAAVDDQARRWIIDEY